MSMNPRRNHRTTRTNVKSGCRTCKIRKVKCDEGRTACRRCISTGRVCDGYGVWAAEAASTAIASALSACRTATKLPASFVYEFWTSLLLTASSSEPAVLHAVLALGSVHKTGIVNTDLARHTRNVPDEQERFMLRHYGKAIDHLQPHFSIKDRTSFRVGLIACVVFICLEFLRGHFHAAQIHFQNGLQLLGEMQILSDGKISPLEFLQATGIPNFRLRTQFRMADGLFDAVAAEVYPDVPFTYAASCQINLQRFATGQALETYVLAKYPEVKSSPTGKLSPIFVHCQGSKVYVNEMTGTKYSPNQVKVALDLATEFVETKNVNPAHFVIVAADMANVDIAAKMWKRAEYSALLAMPPASTVEAYQGKESDIVIAIMSNNANAGAACLDEHRLNVMFIRQRCDINATGGLVWKGMGKGKESRNYRTFGLGEKVH
ncbi:hypothetical protein QQZ08_005089 [Neonectria magnoliae]|uniref:Zn(2)-C6 fungal-type domain-containing protein n=1 Tax=Neonectria magnoliae TaxID=2732573 RepID=A0ABR1I4T0_9HYPO